MKHELTARRYGAVGEGMVTAACACGNEIDHRDTAQAFGFGRRSFVEHVEDRTGVRLDLEWQEWQPKKRRGVR